MHGFANEFMGGLDLLLPSFNFFCITIGSTQTRNKRGAIFSKGGCPRWLAGALYFTRHSQ